jgi:hypothetical protein
MSGRSKRALPPVLPPPAALGGAQAIRRSLARAHRASTTLPLPALLQQTIGMVKVQPVAAFAELGIADALADTPRTTDAVTSEVGAHATAVEGLLAFLATSGLVRRGQAAMDPDRCRRPAAFDHPGSVRDGVRFAGSGSQWRAWEHLAERIWGTPTGPFELANGPPYFDHLAAHPHQGQLFDDAMRSTSRLQGEVPARDLELDGPTCVTSAAEPAPCSTGHRAMPSPGSCVPFRRAYDPVDTRRR